MRNLCRTPSLKALPVLVWALLASAAVRAAGQSDEVLTLDIKAQEVGLALVTLARSSHMQIMLEEETGARVQVKGLKGEYRFEDALSALLADTGLTFEYASRNVVLVQEVEQLVEQAVEQAVDEAGEADDELLLADQIVTGSRLEGGDPTTRIESFSAEDIARRGVSSLEEHFRTLPWFHSSITSQTTSQPGYVVGDDTDPSLSYFGLGVSTANMRALGSANTLVLVDGQRVAGVAGNEGAFVNLSNIPMGSIERIDIQLDGSSSVYGADAIGGVVNIITRKSYNALSASYRQEFSSADADQKTMSINASYGWDSGYVRANLYRTTTRPVNHHKIYASNDFRDQLGPEYDLRDPGIGQPGIVCPWSEDYTYIGCAFRPLRLWRLPFGHTGEGATPDEFVNVQPWEDAAMGDLVEPQNGASSNHNSLTLHAQQDIGLNFRAYASADISKLDSYREFRAQLYNYLVPASNAYNPFGEHVVVSYDPTREIEEGGVPTGYTDTWSKFRRYSAGFDWKIAAHQLELNVTHSETERYGLRSGYPYQRSEFDPNSSKFYEALESSDPAVAINLFGDGTVQGSGFQYVTTPDVTPKVGDSVRTVVQPSLRGTLFHVWGGALRYAVGAEWRRSAIWYSYLLLGEDGRYYEENARVARTGMERPTVDTLSYFAELSFPFVGEDNARPGLRALTLSVKARLDAYKSIGAVGGQTTNVQIDPYRAYVPGEGWQDVGPRYRYERTGDFNLQEIKRDQISPRVGLFYKPVETIEVRAAWSESFRPPRFGQTFSTREPRVIQTLVSDPYHPVAPYRPDVAELVFVTYKPTLQPESSENYSVSINWSPKALPGFRWSVDWSLIDYTNRIVHSTDLVRSYPEAAFKLPEIIDRDEDGLVTRVKAWNINLAEKKSELVNSSLGYSFTTRLGNISSGLRYTRYLQEYFRTSPDAERIETKGTTGGSNESELTASLHWAVKQVSANLFVRYIPAWQSISHHICLRRAGNCLNPSQPLPGLKADSLLTVDLTMAYQFNNGLHLRVGGRNIFSAESPVIWNSRPYDPTRWNARGRVLFVEMSWRN